MDINKLGEFMAGMGGMGVAGTLFFLFIKKSMLKNAVTDTGMEATDAQCSVIEMLRSEVQRMASGNKELGLALQQFQRENIELRQEISSLHDTINLLSERLNSLDRRRENCNGCEFDNQEDNRRNKEISA